MLQLNVNLKQLVGTAVCLLLLSLSAHATEFHVSPSGVASGDGSVTRPWDLATALAQPTSVRPGDTIWLHGGTYIGTFTSVLRGSAAAPIIVRNYRSERAIVSYDQLANATTLTSGSSNTYTWYWGFEVMNSNPVRQIATSGSNPSDSRGTALTVYGPNNKFINLIVHDGGVGIGFWSGADDSEIYGNVIYNNGWEAPDRGHGHSIYVQNATGTKRIVDNVMFSSHSFGIHAYTEGGRIDNIYTEGNIVFNHGLISTSGPKANIIVGGGPVALNPSFISNFTYYTPGTGGRGIDVTYSGCDKATINSNYLVSDVALSLRCTNVVSVQNNSFYGSMNVASQYPSNTYFSARPSGIHTFVRPNKYEAGRANIVVYNWDNAGATQVDLSTVLNPGDVFETRDAQDYFGVPVATGTYSGGSVNVPLKFTTVTAPVGNVVIPPKHTPAEFNAFVVMRSSGSSTSPISVTLTPTQPSLSASQVQQFTPAVVGTTNTGVTWSMSPAGIGTISSAGMYTAPAAIASIKTVMVTATSVADTTKSATATVTLLAMASAPTVTALTPAQGTAGTNVPVTLTGTNFQTGSTVSVGAGITVNSIVVSSSTQLKATLAISSSATLGARAVTVSNPGALSGTLPGSFTVQAAASPATVTLSYSGILRDKVGQGDTALSADGAMDGTFVLTLGANSGTRTVTALTLRNSVGGVWDTVAGDGYWALGASSGLDTALSNGTDSRVNLPLAAGGILMLFASDMNRIEFAPGTGFTVTVTFSDSTTATATATVGTMPPTPAPVVPAPVTSIPSPLPPSPPTVTLSYGGMLRDRVGQGDMALSADGALDGVFTVVLGGTSARTVTTLVLRNSAGGVWDTLAGNGYWALGTSSGLDTPLLNGVDSKVSVNLAAGVSLILFASDMNRIEFVPGTIFTLTVTFSDGTTATATAAVGATPPGPAAATPAPGASSLSQPAALAVTPSFVTAPQAPVASLAPAPPVTVIPSPPVAPTPASVTQSPLPIITPSPATTSFAVASPPSAVPIVAPTPVSAPPSSPTPSTQLPQFSNVAVAQPSPNGAVTLSWTTSVPTSGLVEYATSAAALNSPSGQSKFQRRIERVLPKISVTAAMGTAHSITIPVAEFPSHTQIYYTIMAVLPNGSLSAITTTQTLTTK